MTSVNTSRYRIVFESREHYRVVDQNKKMFSAEIAGRVRQEGELWPAVGDWVEGTLQPGNWVQILKVVDRKSVLSRRDPSENGGVQILAANVDVLLIVTSANQDLNLRRLDRYVALTSGNSAKPVIVVNKMELAGDSSAVLASVKERFPSLEVIGTSVYENWNLDQLQAYARPDQTLAFAGSSGVGKSTLINFLLGEEQIHTQAIRADDDRGRHTTTHRELHFTPTGAIVIDTPGIRQVGLTDDADLGSVFSDIEVLVNQCRFSDCRHSREPGCAVRFALENGELDSDRWESFLKLGKELAYEQRRSSKELQSAEKKKWSKVQLAYRSKQKARGR